jgi:hypothetical protein
MAKRDDEDTAAAGTGSATGSAADSMEQRMLAFAEQLGRVVGTVHAKADGWLDRDALNAQISTVRDSASALLAQLGGSADTTAKRSRPASGSGTNARGSSGQDARRTNTMSGGKGKGTAKAKISGKGKAAPKPRASATGGAGGTQDAGKGRSGGAVDAPGKKHRKPMPGEGRVKGAPRDEGSGIAKLRIRNDIVKRRG